MSGLTLAEVPRVERLSREEFLRDYFKPQRPVVLTGQFGHWKAVKTWSLEYFREIAGDIEVPLYDDRPVTADQKFNEPHARMKMSAYIDLLKSEPTKYRIFLWNLLKVVPSLQLDFDEPDFGLKILKGLPMLFFGGTDSFTFMHYDIDLANIFHFHFEGKKECILYPLKESKYLYKLPYALITREDIRFDQPDLELWPALSHARGFRAELGHGEMLYIPEGYWHYMQYKTPGFSMSLRALPHKPGHLAQALYNIFVMRHYDNAMRKWKGQEWLDWKNEEALRRTRPFEQARMSVR